MGVNLFQGKGESPLACGL